MENKINRQTEKRKMDKLLEEQYAAETKILESALLKASGKTSWEEFPEESEEKVQREYDRLVARLKAKGEYREAVADIRTERLEETKEHLKNYENEWNRTHRFLKPVAAVVAAVMLTALAGMTVSADLQFEDETVQTCDTSFSEEK